MKAIAAWVGLVLIIWRLVYLLIIYLIWHNCGETYKYSPRVSFKAFREFYAVAPDKWDVDWDDRYAVYEDQRILFLNYTDFLKYRRYRKRILKQIGDFKKDKQQAKFIKEVQKDIDKYRREAIEKMQRESTQDIMKEMKK